MRRQSSRGPGPSTGPPPLWTLEQQRTDDSAESPVSENPSFSCEAPLVRHSVRRVGRNNKERRQAKRRARIQRRVTSGQRSTTQRRRGESIDVWGTPWETIYHDQPDFLMRCTNCNKVGGIPLYSMKPSREFAERYPGMPDTVLMNCPGCGQETFKVQPRHEVGPDGRSLYVIDRAALEAAGAKEWSADIYGVTLQDRRSGEMFTLTMSDNHYEIWVVCDECGLPFRHRATDHAITAAGPDVNVNFIVGPCEHCGGSGRPLMARSTNGTMTTIASTVEFADVTLAHLAERLRTGEIDVDTAISELRSQNTRPLSRLADWMESRPVTTAAAGVLLSIVATLVAPQIPTVTGGDDPQPDTYTEEQVVELLEAVLKHYDQAQPTRPDGEGPNPLSDEPGDPR